MSEALHVQLRKELQSCVEVWDCGLLLGHIIVGAPFGQQFIPKEELTPTRRKAVLAAMRRMRRHGLPPLRTEWLREVLFPKARQPFLAKLAEEAAAKGGRS